MTSHNHHFPGSLCRPLAGVWLAVLLLTGCGSGNPPVIPTQTAPSADPEPPVFEAVYLPFERGFMVYAEGRGCLYAYAERIILPRDDAEEFSSYRYCLPFDHLPEGPEGGPPGPFGRVWAFYAEVADALGAADGGIVRYESARPPGEPPAAGGVFYNGELTLPDGAMLYCGMRAATAGSCVLRGP